MTAKLISMAERKHCSETETISADKTMETFVDTATNSFIRRDFQNCLDICNEGISLAKDNPRCYQQSTELFCTLAIQAFAELNIWQEVLPFVRKVYNGIEDCPEKVIQMCILLYAKVEEFSLCQTVVTVWLRNPLNHLRPQYSAVVRLFTTHVLIPQEQWSGISRFVDSCKALPTNVRDEILQLVDESREQKVQEENAHTAQSDEKREEYETEKLSVDNFVQRCGAVILRVFPFVRMGVIMKVMCAAVLIYIAAIQSQKGDLINNLGPATILWQGILKLLKSIIGS